ncbi:muconate cycloisomerase [Erythrobacter sp. GH3-10]|uniref:Muconate cycloisomerase n=2 Tax=Aurantiacibacter rhizosphaerae TaxID=2691582 RepID=A0A844XHM4_9SPHN|nr:muconate cycloisomerase [Aurantiacibacter rhizosphaerae]
MLVDVPTIRPHKLAMAVMHCQVLCLVKITCSDGVVGWGEGTTIGGLAYGPESPESIKVNIDSYLAPLLIGQSADPFAASARMAAHIAGNNFARCAVETALFDAQGKRQGVPVSDLLGTRVRDAVPVLWVLASGDTAADIAEAEDMIARRRHNVFKLKIGRRELAEDVAHVARIKRALGDAISIRVDVNMAWDRHTAMRGIAMLADVGCDLVEQPLVNHDVAGMAELKAQGKIAIMADESLTGPVSAQAFIDADAADVFAVKIEQSAGLIAAGRVGAMADAAGTALYGGTMLESAIGSIAAAQLFCTFPNLQWGTELFAPLLLTQEILTTPLTYRDFALEVPQAPGLGITPDEVAIARLARGAPTRTITHG